MTHTVYADELGGSITLTCDSLNMKNAEYVYSELTPEGVKDTISHFRVMGKAEYDTLEIDVVDRRKI